MSIQLVKQLYAAIERTDLATLASLYDDTAEQVEFPNRLLPQGARRDKAALLQAAQRGAALLSQQSLAIVHAVEDGDDVAVEAEWNARLAVDVPTLGLRAGDAMHARFAQFLTFRDGRVVRHHTYDCFTVWENHHA